MQQPSGIMYNISFRMWVSIIIKWNSNKQVVVLFFVFLCFLLFYFYFFLFEMFYLIIWCENIFFLSVVNQRHNLSDNVSLGTMCKREVVQHLPHLNSHVGMSLGNFFWTQECPLDTSLLESICCICINTENVSLLTSGF